MKQKRKEQFPAHLHENNVLPCAKTSQSYNKEKKKKKHYKPIALMNIWKYPIKLNPANHKKIIHCNQVGFIPRIQGRCNIQSPITVKKV